MPYGGHVIWCIGTMYKASHLVQLMRGHGKWRLGTHSLANNVSRYNLLHNAFGDTTMQSKIYVEITRNA